MAGAARFLTGIGHLLSFSESAPEIEIGADQEKMVRTLIGPLVKLASFKSLAYLDVRAYFDTRTLRSTASILLVEASKIIEL